MRRYQLFIKIIQVLQITKSFLRARRQSQSEISVHLHLISVRLRPSSMTAAISTGDNKSGSAAAAIKLVSRRVRDRAKVKPGDWGRGKTREWARSRVRGSEPEVGCAPERCRSSVCAQPPAQTHALADRAMS